MYYEDEEDLKMCTSCGVERSNLIDYENDELCDECYACETFASQPDPEPIFICDDKNLLIAKKLFKELYKNNNNKAFLLERNNIGMGTYTLKDIDFFYLYKDLIFKVNEVLHEDGTTQITIIFELEKQEQFKTTFKDKIKEIKQC